MYNVSFSFSNRAQELNCDNSKKVPNQYFLLTDHIQV